MKPEISLSLNNLRDFPLYAEASKPLATAGELPFVEILWDNYCHLEPEEILAALGPYSGRISLHVMMSKFLERDEAQLEEFLDRLSYHVTVLQPVRVSDHLARFRSGHLNVVVPLEHDYDRLDHVCARIDRYQQSIGMPLLLENYASTEPQGVRQIEFIDTLLMRTGCELLFDISNAVVAELNGFGRLDDWYDYLEGRRVHCHVGGYAANEKTGLVHDTHNSDLSPETIDALQRFVSAGVVESVCYERDYDKSVEAFDRDLATMRSVTEGKCR